MTCLPVVRPNRPVALSNSWAFEASLSLPVARGQLLCTCCTTDPRYRLWLPGVFVTAASNLSTVEVPGAGTSGFGP